MIALVTTPLKALWNRILAIEAFGNNLAAREVGDPHVLPYCLAEWNKDYWQVGMAPGAPTKFFECLCLGSGEVLLQGYHNGNTTGTISNVYAYVNGVFTGLWHTTTGAGVAEFDLNKIAVQKGDLLQLYCKRETATGTIFLWKIRVLTKTNCQAWPKKGDLIVYP